MNAFVYILRCSDGRYYVSTTRTSLEARVAEHNAGTHRGYTWNRRPVELVFHEAFDRFHEPFDRITDAIAAERKLKGWSRAKKEALIQSDFRALKQAAKRKMRSG